MIVGDGTGVLVESGVPVKAGEDGMTAQEDRTIAMKAREKSFIAHDYKHNSPARTGEFGHFSRVRLQVVYHTRNKAMSTSGKFSKAGLAK